VIRHDLISRPVSEDARRIDRSCIALRTPVGWVRPSPKPSRVRSLDQLPQQQRKDYYRLRLY
jgi:hypothetical protein